MKGIREWYMEAFPTDELGAEISADATFEGLFETLDHYQDVYEYLGEADSLVRERCFAELARVMGVEYDYVYDQWMRAA